MVLIGALAKVGADMEQCNYVEPIVGLDACTDNVLPTNKHAEVNFYATLLCVMIACAGAPANYN